MNVVGRGAALVTHNAVTYVRALLTPSESGLAWPPARLIPPPPARPPASRLAVFDAGSDESIMVLKIQIMWVTKWATAPQRFPPSEKEEMAL